MQLLFRLNRPYEVASRGYPFIISFSKALAVYEVIHLDELMPKCLGSYSSMLSSCLHFFLKKKKILRIYYHFACAKCGW